MIFNYYSRVAVKLGDERYEFDHDALMFSDAAMIERTCGMAYDQWEFELRQGSILAKAALLHMLRKKAGKDVAWDDMEFRAEDLIIIPLHDDGSEYTPAEALEGVERKARARAIGKPDPTDAAEDSAAGQEPRTPETTPLTSLTSPGTITSAPGNGRSSNGTTSSGSKRTRMRA